MTAVCTWSVTGLSVFTDEDYQDVINSVDWEVSAEQGKQKASLTGTTPLARPSLGFTAYEELLESQVLDWVKGGLGGVRVAEIETNVLSQLETTKYETKKLPWKSK